MSKSSEVQEDSLGRDATLTSAIAVWTSELAPTPRLSPDRESRDSRPNYSSFKTYRLPHLKVARICLHRFVLVLAKQQIKPLLEFCGAAHLDIEILSISHSIKFQPYSKEQL